MSDAWQDLPLSRRRAADDESGVSNDWRLKTVDALRSLAALLETLDAEQLAADSLRPRPGMRDGSRFPVGQIAGLVLADLDSRSLDRLLRRRTAIPEGAGPRELRERADSLVTAGARGALRPLAVVVQAAADVSVPLGLPDPITPLASGAVALSLATAAPASLRGVLRERSVVPDDASWDFARGPAIRASSAELVAWLGGRDVAPRFDPPGR